MGNDRRLWGLTICGAGLLAGLALAPLGLPALLWPALALLWALAGSAPSGLSRGRWPLLAAGIWGLAAVLVSHRWLLWLHPLDWIGVPAPLSLPICLALWLGCGVLGGGLVALWLGLMRRLDASRPSTALIGSLLWGLAEVQLARGPLFWLGLGSSALPGDRLLAGLAALAGAGAVAAVQLLIAWCLWRALAPIPGRRRWLLAGLALVAAAHLAGASALAAIAPQAGATERLLVLQPAIPTRHKFEPRQQQALLRFLAAAQRRTAPEPNGGSAAASNPVQSNRDPSDQLQRDPIQSNPIPGHPEQRQPLQDPTAQSHAIQGNAVQDSAAASAPVQSAADQHGTDRRNTDHRNTNHRNPDHRSRNHRSTDQTGTDQRPAVQSVTHQSTAAQSAAAQSAALQGASSLVLPEGSLALGQPLPLPAGIEVLSGGFRQEGLEQRSSLLRFDPGTLLASGWVDKHRLVPLGEWVPLADLWRWGGLSAVGGLEPGPATRLLERPAGSVAVAICYELSDGSALAAASRAGAGWLLASANLDPYPLLLQQQFKALAQLRAIETGRWLISAANTGPSMLIDARGRLIDQLPPGLRRSGLMQLHRLSALTPYARWGEAPLLLLLTAAVGTRLLERRPLR